MRIVEAETGDGVVVDSAELQQLADLGLPTSFASAQVITLPWFGLSSCTRSRQG